MNDASGEWIAPDEGALREWMFNYLLEHTGDDCAYLNILQRGISRYGDLIRLNGDELDRARIFRELVSTLNDLMGSEEAAADWLTHSTRFEEFGGVPPIHYLQEGGFWSLSLLCDTLKIAKAHPSDPLGLKLEMTSIGSAGTQQSFTEGADRGQV